MLPAVRLITRNGNDFTRRFPLAASAVAALPVRSCLIDGEAIVTDDNGLAVFELIRRARHGAQAVLCAFDLLALDGADLRRLPIQQRKDRLATLLHNPPHGIVLNAHYVGDGGKVFREACKLGCEGIVSKRLARTIAPAAQPRGSRSKTRRRQRCGARLKKSGADRGACRADVRYSPESDQMLRRRELTLCAKSDILRRRKSESFAVSNGQQSWQLLLGPNRAHQRTSCTFRAAWFRPPGSGCSVPIRYRRARSCR